MSWKWSTAANVISYLGNPHHPIWAGIQPRIEKLLEYPAACTLLIPQFASKVSPSLCMKNLDPAQWMLWENKKM